MQFPSLSLVHKFSLAFFPIKKIFQSWTLSFFARNLNFNNKTPVLKHTKDFRVGPKHSRLDACLKTKLSYPTLSSLPTDIPLTHKGSVK